MNIVKRRENIESTSFQFIFSSYGLCFDLHAVYIYIYDARYRGMRVQNKLNGEAHIRLKAPQHLIGLKSVNCKYNIKSILYTIQSLVLSEKCQKHTQH